MFGYIIANHKSLTRQEEHRYRELYCGLCRSLKSRHGQRSRLALNYDMTFLIMVLGSLYEPKECKGKGRCYVHPVKKRCFAMSDISDYAADMNVALAYQNLLDDWRDDKNIFSLLGAKLLGKSWRRVSESLPRQCGTIKRCLRDLRQLEKAGEPDPGRGAMLFGQLLAEVFVWREDRWEAPLREMAFNLGQFIYLMDAAADLERDLKKGAYNPLAALKAQGKDDDYFQDLLTVLLGECIRSFDRLPLVEDVSIMKNILCSGIWIRYESLRRKHSGERKESRL